MSCNYIFGLPIKRAAKHIFNKGQTTCSSKNYNYFSNFQRRDNLPKSNYITYHILNDGNVKNMSIYAKTIYICNSNIFSIRLRLHYLLCIALILNHKLPFTCACIKKSL